MSKEVFRVWDIKTGISSRCDGTDGTVASIFLFTSTAHRHDDVRRRRHSGEVGIRGRVDRKKEGRSFSPPPKGVLSGSTDPRSVVP